MRARTFLGRLLGLLTVLFGLAGCISAPPYVNYVVEADPSREGAVASGYGVVMTGVSERAAVEVALVTPQQVGTLSEVLVSTLVANTGNDELEFKPSDVMMVVTNPFTGMASQGGIVIFSGDDEIYAYSDAYESLFGGAVTASSESELSREINPIALDGTTIANLAGSPEGLSAALENVVARREYRAEAGIESFLLDSTVLPPRTSLAGGVGLALVGWYVQEDDRESMLQQMADPARLFSDTSSVEQAIDNPALLYQLTDDVETRGPSPTQLPEMRTQVSIVGQAGAPPPRVRLFLRTGEEIYGWDLAVYQLSR
jgi:hypothetical protein